MENYNNVDLGQRGKILPSRVKFANLYKEVEYELEDELEEILEFEDEDFDVPTLTINGRKYVASTLISDLFNKQHSKVVLSIVDIMNSISDGYSSYWDIAEYFIVVSDRTNGSVEETYYISLVGFLLLSSTLMNNVSGNMNKKIRIAKELSK